MLKSNKIQTYPRKEIKENFDLKELKHTYLDFIFYKKKTDFF